jgi:hypothetical protein
LSISADAMQLLLLLLQPPPPPPPDDAAKHDTNRASDDCPSATVPAGLRLSDNYILHRCVRPKYWCFVCETLKEALFGRFVATAMNSVCICHQYDANRNTVKMAS